MRLGRKISYLTLAALVSVAGGCAAIGGGAKPLATFDLNIPDVADAKTRKQGVQILIAEPQALKALDSESIVVRTGGSSIEYLAGTQWGDRLPKIVQARLVQAFENSGRFGGVGRPGEGLAIDYQVITDIRAFEIDATAGKVAKVEISAKLLNDRNGVVAAVKVFEASVPAGAVASSFIPALDKAFSQAATGLVQWVSSKV